MRPRPLTPPKKRRRIRGKYIAVSLLLVATAIAYTAITITRPFANMTPTIPTSTLSITTPSSTLPWPAYGEGAFGLVDGTVIATHGDQQKQVPIASVAKVITALVILDKHQFSPSENGPTITLQERDVELYNRYVAIRGSVMPVRAGQTLTLRQMLEGLLLPSANNIGDSLALWSFGSIDGYLDYANQYLQKHGMKNTHVGGDASGYLEDSVSTTSDLITLGGLAMQNSVIAQIVSQKSAVIPGVGTVRNYNNLIGVNGVNGIKTGNNDGNLGVFVGSTTASVNGETITLITALSNAPNLSTVLRDSGTLLTAVRSTFADTTIVKKDTILGTYQQSDGSRIQAIAAADLHLTVLRGDSIKANVSLDDISFKTRAGETVGSVSVPASKLYKAQSVPIILKQTPVKPTLWYRLTHP